MKLTAAFKKWLVENCGVKNDAADEDFRKAAAEAFASGDLSPEKYAELSVEPEDKAAAEGMAKLDALTDVVGKLVETLSKPKEVEKPEEKAEAPKEEKADPAPPKQEPEETKAQETKEPGTFTKLVSRLSEGQEGVDVRVKHAIEQYSDTKSAMIYPSHNEKGRPHRFAGQQCKNFDRPMEEPSQRDKAIAGAYAKFAVAVQQKGSRNLAFNSLNEHDKSLLYWAMENEKWAGSTSHANAKYADIIDRKLTPTEQKALIDDATSGGLEAAPIVFDDLVIQTPLLHGELFPLVNTIPLDRGRRVEGVVTGTVSASWAGVDATAITLFDTGTPAYVSAFDTTIFRWEGAIQIGLDFMSDTPIDFSSHVTAQYGERLLEDLDDVIAAGDGTTQPEGVINKTSVTSIPWAGSTTLGNYELLRFGVAKNEFRANVAGTAVFCGTETSYQRARSLAVGASDARRLGGMDYGSYTWMEHPYKINEALTNAQIFFALLGRYRMYRRRGLTLRTSTEGRTLMLDNSMVIVATARYGGQLERSTVAAVTTTAPA